MSTHPPATSARSPAGDQPPAGAAARSMDAEIAAANPWAGLRSLWDSPWPSGPFARGPQWRAKRWSRFAAPWLIYLGYPLVSAWHKSLGVRGVALVGLVLFAGLYLFAVPRAIPGDARRRFGTIGVMLALSVLLTVLIGLDGLATAVYDAAAGVVLMSPVISMPMALALAAVMVGLPPLVPGWHASPQWSSGLSVLGAAFIGFAVVTLIRSNSALRVARDEVASLAAEQERLRIGRDIHDLLGHSLTTVTVKAELARRLMRRDLDRAEAELADVERLSRQALADVRAAVAGYREVSLAVEVATAGEVLAAAGIEADLPRAVDDVPGELRELFGWAVREGVTNAVRHSRAGVVRISVGPRSVEVLDDGPGCAAEPAGRAGGAGLSGLAERAARAGGSLVVGPVPGGYRLRVEVPDLGRPEPEPVAG
jgi:two-component system, NarL family, sensor histidine kinase DesK